MIEPFAGLVRSPEIEGGPWFNSSPLALKSLLGKVVLVDFWTYSCVNCVRTLPYLKSWYEKYSQDSLVIVGVHTPEFDFEKDPANVQRAVQDFGIKYPVVMDSDYKTWTNFANHYWPRKYLIDGKGYIRYDHAGEGGYAETEREIQKLLKEVNKDFSEKEITVEDKESHGGICYPQTPETYCGYLRGNLLNGPYKEDQVAEYFNSGNHQEGGIYLSGSWLAKGEYIQHASTDLKDYLAIVVKGVEVNLVIKAAQVGEFEVSLTWNGQPAPREMQGDDVTEEGGQTRLRVNEPRMYQLLKSKDFFQGELRLSSSSDKVQFYAFTFGGCPH